MVGFGEGGLGGELLWSFVQQFYSPSVHIPHAHLGVNYLTILYIGIMLLKIIKMQIILLKSFVQVLSE